MKELLSRFTPKKFMPLPILLLLASLLIVGLSYQGGTIPMSIELKGGTLITLYHFPESFDVGRALESTFGYEVQESTIRDFSGAFIGRSLQINEFLKGEESERVKKFLIEQGVPEEGISLRSVGPSLSATFLEQAIKAVLFAFLFMAAVIFLRFRTVVPSIAVVLSAFSDIVTTLAVMILWGIQLSSGSLVALLLLIGYSVDTDIVLTTRLLVSKKAPFQERLYSAMRTGLTMTATTFVAVSFLYLVSTSVILREIATVILIGMVIDTINTWIQNAGILQIYVERG
jgi:preprotein translocase subunit SecF